MVDKLLIIAISTLVTLLFLSLGLLFYAAIVDAISMYGLSSIVVAILAVTVFGAVYRKIKQEWEGE